MAMISKFGNLPVTCPIVKGNFFIKDYHLDPDSIIFSIFQYKNEGLTNHLMRFVFWDENLKKPVKVFKFDYYFSINKKK
jgi:hypothetical protein